MRHCPSFAMLSIEQDWKQDFATRCEAEAAEITRVWQNHKDTIEYGNIPEALDSWRHGPREIFSLAVAFRDEFSFLRCLERECQKLDVLLVSLNKETKPDLQGIERRSIKTGINAYNLSYFEHDQYLWVETLDAWVDNPFATGDLRMDEKKAHFIALETHNFALLDAMEEAYNNFDLLWKEWSFDAFSVMDGMDARIKALSYLEQQSTRVKVLDTCTITGTWDRAILRGSATVLT